VVLLREGEGAAAAESWLRLEDGSRLDQTGPISRRRRARQRRCNPGVPDLGGWVGFGLVGLSSQHFDNCTLWFQKRVFKQAPQHTHPSSHHAPQREGGDPAEFLRDALWAAPLLLVVVVAVCVLAALRFGRQRVGEGGFWGFWGGRYSGSSGGGSSSGGGGWWGWARGRGRGGGGQQQRYSGLAGADSASGSPTAAAAGGRAAELSALSGR